MKYYKIKRISMICMLIVCTLFMTACVSSPASPKTANEPDSGLAFTSAADINYPIPENFDVRYTFPDFLATYSTTYDQSNKARSSNLALAREYIDGTILEPGEVFSFNSVVGERTPEQGFRKVTDNYGEEPCEEYGGGVCQTSSTLFYCAVKADLEVVKRTGHRYTVEYMTDPNGNMVYGNDAIAI